MFDEQPDADPHGECAAEIHRLVWQLALILPMAKAHAAAHPVGSNADIVRRAEEVLREHVPPNDGLGAIPLNEGKAGDDGGKGVPAPAEWAGKDMSILIYHLRHHTHFDADLIEQMLTFAQHAANGIPALDNQTSSASSTGGVESEDRAC